MPAEKASNRHALRNTLLSALLGAVMAASGFLAKDYWASTQTRDASGQALHKILYDQGAAALAKVNAAYAELYRLYGKVYAISTYEQEPSFTKFRDAMEAYVKYVNELEHYGNAAEVQVATSLRDALRAMYSGFHGQYALAEGMQRRAKALLLVEDQESAYFTEVSLALSEDLDELMQAENRLFYEIGWRQKPVCDALERSLYAHFRRAIGLAITADIHNAVHEGPPLSQSETPTVYQESKTPFVLAAQRAMLTPPVTATGDEDVLERKNAMLKDQVTMKFLTLAIEHDQELRETLEKRKTHH
jgi:hypothetical protein